jgi:hypothetical protein
MDRVRHQGYRLGTSGHGTLQQMWERACSRIGPKGIKVTISHMGPGIKLTLSEYSKKPSRQNPLP